MVTFNHEQYIIQAIESVLQQQSAQPFELVIGDDCSTDATTSIVADYQRRYPHIVRVLLRERNLGFQDNFLQTLFTCRGRFVATLDGDDYWLSHDKLSKQVGILETRPECAICCAQSIEIYDDSSHPPSISPVLQHVDLNLADLLYWDFIPTCTAVFRAGLLDNIPAWIRRMPMVDWVLWILLAQCGDIVHIPEPLGVYRKHSQGIWSKKNVEERIHADETFYSQMRTYLPTTYHTVIDQRLARLARLLKELKLPGHQRHY